jgi:prepilin peptidase CpaA
MLSAAALILFPWLMAYAASSDLFTMTISNWVSMVLVGGFLILASSAGMPALEMLRMHLACGATVLVLTFALFAFGWIGGGDAKLAAATAVWLGWDNLYAYGLATSIFGGALTLLILHWRKFALPPILNHQEWVKRLHADGTGVPYGIALAVAGLMLYPDTTIWSAAAGA